MDTESDWLQGTLGKQLCGSEGERVGVVSTATSPSRASCVVLRHFHEPSIRHTKACQIEVYGMEGKMESMNNTRGEARSDVLPMILGWNVEGGIFASATSGTEERVSYGYVVIRKCWRIHGGLRPGSSAA